MSGYLIIQWPDGDRKILDHNTSDRYVDYETLEKYRQLFKVRVDWCEANQKEWLHEQGFLP